MKLFAIEPADTKADIAGPESDNDTNRVRDQRSRICDKHRDRDETPFSTALAPQFSESEN